MMLLKHASFTCNGVLIRGGFAHRRPAAVMGPSHGVLDVEIHPYEMLLQAYGCLANEFGDVQGRILSRSASAFPSHHVRSIVIRHLQLAFVHCVSSTSSANNITSDHGALPVR